MLVTKIYYSVDNCGDGSAYPIFFENEELAKFHQYNLSEGWGEPCIGSITLESNSPIICKECKSKETYYFELLDEVSGYDDSEYSKPYREKLKDFLEEFFIYGLPKFSAQILDKEYYGIFLQDKLVYKYFAYPEETTNETDLQKLKEKWNLI